MANPKLGSAFRVGCAGWSHPKGDRFPPEGSHLGRYAARLLAVEINSSFYKPHMAATYARWAGSVPPGFRFSVKVPGAITHEHRLAGVGDLLDGFLAGVIRLGEKLGPLLVQLPPSLRFSADVAEGFFAALRGRFAGGVALEPRHASWFGAAPDRLAIRYRIARVAADPVVVAAAAEPGGFDGLVYYRLHGSPEVYRSAYDDSYLVALSRRLDLAARASEVWCIFDNTAEGAATDNALDLLGRHAPGSGG